MFKRSHREALPASIFDDIKDAFTEGADLIKSEFTGKEPKLVKKIKEADEGSKIFKDVDIISHDIEKHVKLIPKEVMQEPKALADVGTEIQDVFEGKKGVGTAAKETLKDVTGGGKYGGLDLLALPTAGLSQLLNKHSFIRETARDVGLKPIETIGKDLNKIEDVAVKVADDGEKVIKTAAKAIDFFANHSTLLLVAGGFVAYKILVK